MTDRHTTRPLPAGARAGRWLACTAIAWGAFAFGGVYPWAYWPLVALCATSGVGGLYAGRQHRLPRDARLLAASLALVAAASCVQLVPWPLHALTRVSPVGLRIVEQLDVTVALDLVAAHALSINPAATARALALYAGFVLMIVGLARLPRHEIHRLVWIVSWVGAALAITAIIQKPLYRGAIYGFWRPLTEGGAFGPFVNRNHFAGWMLMAIPLAFGYFCAALSRWDASVHPTLRHRVLWLSSRDASRAIQAGFAVVIMGLALVLTLSRSGLIGLGAVLILCGAAALRRQRGLLGRALTVASLGLLSAAIVVWAGADAVSARFAAADTAALGGRLSIWRGGVEMLKDFWLTGAGLNTYGTATLFYPPAVPGRHVGEAHNEYLQLAVEGGCLVGVPIAVAIVVFALSVIRRLRAAAGPDYWIRLGAVAGLAAIAVQSSVDFSLQIPADAALFSALCAVALHQGPHRREQARDLC